METQAYSQAEARAAGDSFPDRALECPKSKVRIPQFEGLSAEGEQRIPKLIPDGRHLNAMYELRAVTGCKGRVVMFAFRPQYRGQSVATLPFLFNAIAGSVSR